MTLAQSIIAQLNLNGIELQKTQIIAQTGWKTSDLLNGIVDSTLNEYNLVSFYWCHNNSGVNHLMFFKPFDSLVGIAKEAVGNDRIFIVSIPDYGVTPYGSSNSENIANDIDMYNGYIRSLYREGFPFINVTEISRQLGSSNGALASDNLHPIAPYSLWVNEILPLILEIVR